MVESDTSYDRAFDIQVYLNTLWLEKMASDPLYDGAITSTNVKPLLREVQKKK